MKRVFVSKTFLQTIVVAIQTAEHESKLLLVLAKILRELLKVQLTIMIGVTLTYNLVVGKGNIK